MSIFTESERIFLTEMRAITTDSQGQEVLVGLTMLETEFYLDYSRRGFGGADNLGREDGARYLELCNKHECARLSILAAENQLRVDKLTLN